MRYYVKYNIIKSAIVDFNSASRAMNTYAQRLGRVRTTISTDSNLSSIRSNVNLLASSVNTAAAAATSLGKCIENVRIEYINSEQRAFQQLNRNSPHSVRGIGAFANAFANKGSSILSRWRNVWTLLLPSPIIVGPAVVITTWPFINWGFLTPVIDWIKNPFGRLPKWDPVEPQPEPAPKPEPQPEPMPEPKPKPKPAPQPAPKSQPQQPPHPPGNITAWELEADLRMYREGHALRNEYLPRWRAANTEAEKMTVLNNMLADLQRIKGTSANPEIRFRSGGSWGQYMTLERVIVINKDRMNSPDVLKVLMHEVRHAYHAEAAGIYGPSNHPVSDERSQIWRNDFVGGGLNRNSPIEVDARWFSGGI